MDAWLEKVLTTDFLHLTIPYFFLFIFIELTYSWYKQKHWYRLNDMISSLTCGAVSHVFHIMTTPMLLAIYVWVEKNYGLFAFEQLHGWAKLTAVVTLFIGCDFCYYWFHRVGHRVNIGWATHIVHHSSEEYNLSTALRQGIVQHYVSFWFYLPLALLGFPLLWYVAMYSLVSLYQVWLHTQWINKMPRWFEYIFNTPSHHRIHHAMQRKYLDKNYAGTLIIWDRMFGSFKEEKEAPEYGTTVPLRTWSPIIAQLDYFLLMAHSIKHTPRWQDKLRFLWKNPGWQPKGAHIPPPKCHAWQEGYQKYDPSMTPMQGALAFVIFVVAFGIGLHLIFDGNMSFLLKTAMYLVSIGLFAISARIMETNYGQSRTLSPKL